MTPPRRRKWAKFTPIGTSAAPFKGTFNGNSKVINNLNIRRSGHYYNGLFGYAYQAIIKNVGLTNVNVKGDDHTGAIVGLLEGSELTSAYATGTVTGGPASGVAVRGVGLAVGSIYHLSTVRRCFATGTVGGGAETIGGALERAARDVLAPQA